MSTHQVDSPPKYLTAHAISQSIGRHPSSVMTAISRLGITPAFDGGPCKYYHPKDIETIQSGMRRKNGQAAEKQA